MKSTFVLVGIVSTFLINVNPIMNDVYSYSNKFDLIEMSPYYQTMDGYSTSINYAVSFISKKTTNFSINISAHDLIFNKTISFYEFSGKNSGSYVDNICKEIEIKSSKIELIFSLFVEKRLVDKLVIEPPYAGGLSYGALTNPSPYKMDKTFLRYRLNEGISYYSETITLFGFEPIIYTTKSNQLDLSDLKIQIDSDMGYGFSYESVTMLLDDKYELFKDIGRIGNYKMSNIKLKCELEDENTAHIDFDMKMYVNPSTFLMSDHPIDGYVETDKFYIPKERINDVRDSVRLFVIKGLGVNLLSVGYSFQISSSKKLIGNCIDSEYCIDIEEDNPDFEIGKVITR